MKLSISRGELQKGLARIQSIVEKRNSMPILANVLLEATTERGGGSGRLIMMATDLEIGIRGVHPAAVKKAGSVTASGKKLFEIVRELPDELIHLEATSNAYLNVRCARSEFSLAGSAAEEYPTLPVASPERMATTQAALLSEMIERTMYAASADETRYNLNGVYLEAQPDTGKLRMVATDGHRLAYVDRTLGSEIDGLSPGVIVPRKGLAELKRLVDEDDADEIEIGFEGNSGLVRKGDVTLVMRLIEGEFPNYRQVIPKEAGQSLVLATETLRHAVRRVALFSAERSRAIKLELAENLLRLSSANPDLGEAHEELDVDYSGEAFSVAFNARYLLDSLVVVHSKEVRLTFRDALSPAQLVPTDDADSLAVVMPMRL